MQSFVYFRCFLFPRASHYLRTNKAFIMKLSIAISGLLAIGSANAATTTTTTVPCTTTTSTSSQSTSTPGYFTDFSTLPGNNTFSFGRHYAVLNLDLIVGLVSGIADTPSGQTFINCTAKWISAVHSQSPPPLSIFTRIYFSNAYRPEIGPATPFGAAVAALGNATSTSPQSQLYPAFVPSGGDVVLQKSRYYAGAGNGLEEILASQQIDTVILVSFYLGSGL